MTDITYTPPIENSLHGSKYLSEDVEEAGYSPSELRSPGVYAIQCCQPDDPREAWLRHYEVLPEYIEELEDADTIVYVGASADMYDRLIDHADRDVRKAALLKVCPPYCLLDVEHYDTADRAFDRESRLAIKLQNEHPSWYVHSF